MQDHLQAEAKGLPFQVLQEFPVPGWRPEQNPSRRRSPPLLPTLPRTDDERLRYRTRTRSSLWEAEHHLGCHKNRRGQTASPQHHWTRDPQYHVGLRRRGCLRPVSCIVPSVKDTWLMRLDRGSSHQ